MNKSILAYNQYCRKVLSDKRILSYLLKISLQELKEISLETIESLIDNIHIEGNTHMLFPRNSEVLLLYGKIVYDILFTLQLPDSNHSMDMLINVELQNNDHPQSKDGKTYPILKRAGFYGSVAIGEQKGYLFTNDNYQDIKKVVSIWINTDVEKERKNSIKRYNYAESEHLGNYYTDQKEDYDLVELIMLNLGEEDTLEILGPLNELFVRKNSVEEKLIHLKEKYGIEVYEETKGEVESMCNLGENLVEKGRIEGINEGEKQKLIDNLRKLMKNLNFSYEEAASLLELTEKEIEKYRELMFQ